MSQLSGEVMLIAAENGEFESVREIFTHPDYGHTLRDIFHKERKNNPLVLAAKSGNLKLVKLLIEKLNFDKESVGTVLFSQDEDQIAEAPVLWTAATSGHLHLVKYLISIGCDVNKPTQTSSTPIRGACYDGHLEVVKYLVGCGGNFNTPNENGQTPLLVACGMNHARVVQYLINIGADLNVQAVKGLTALHIACERDYTDIASLLLGAGAKLLLDEQGATAPMLAAVNGHDDTLTTLLDKYPDCLHPESKADLYTVLGCSKYDRAIQGRGQDTISTVIQYWFRASSLRDRFPQKSLAKIVKNRVNIPEVYGNNSYEPLTTSELLQILPDDSKVGIFTLQARERILGPSHYLIYFLRLRAAIELDRNLYERSLLLLDRSVLLSYTALRPNNNPLRYLDQNLFILQCHGMAYRDQKCGAMTSLFFEYLTMQIEMFFRNHYNCSTQEIFKSGDDENLIEIWLHELVLLVSANGAEHEDRIEQLINRIASLGYRSKKHGRSVLHIACCLDTKTTTINSELVGHLWPNTDFLKLLCKYFDVDSRDNSGSTPLLTVVQYTTDYDLRYEMVELLLENGAHPDTLSYIGQSAADCEYNSANSLQLWSIKNLLWKYTSLKCRAARIICKDMPRYRERVPPSLAYFFSLH
ncbi:FEM-1 [Oopsacas minuta]|uniref:FEM-1 n=1 Tax=Oopsacas minuta TaxID=111878 RepID=A0AAV7JT71_9METZ|nr:FEM-1 [Oopsacas minuta]